MTRRLLAVLAVLLLVAGLQLTRIRTWRVLRWYGVVAAVVLATLVAVGVVVLVRDHFRQR
ncbi:MAG TPA: hypothetical protein VJN96_06195 [Vicinamibacterales bacterium]|nr:hypothetical protein [Vicinamibacterales bacterium]